MPDRKGLFDFRGHWIDYERGPDGEPVRNALYEYWYDRGRRKTRRRSLRTDDLQTACQTLIERVTAEDTPEDRQSPAKAYLSLTLERYLRMTDAQPSGPTQRIGAGHIVAYFGGDCTIADLTPERQREFMRVLSDEKGHSVAYISRILSVLSAALNRAMDEGHLSSAPRILAGKSTVAEILDKPAPQPREWIPTMAQLGAIYDNVPRDHQRRAIILMLTTMARPEAVLELQRGQRNGRVIDLNPKGRRQNKKYRPTIRACDCLTAWLDHWEATDEDTTHYVHYAGGPVGAVKKGIKAAGVRVGVPQMHQYAIRHFMATELHARGAPEDQIAEMMGHRNQAMRTTNWYIKFRPEFLADVTAEIDRVMSGLQAHAEKPLLAPTTHPHSKIARLVSC